MGKEHRLVDMQEICSDNMNTAYENKKRTLFRTCSKPKEPKETQEPKEKEQTAM